MSIEDEILNKWRLEALSSRLILEHENNKKIVELIDEILEAKKVRAKMMDEKDYIPW